MALAAWRERRAQDTDQPRSRVLKDDALIEVAQQRPTAPEMFDKLRAVQRGYGRSAAAGEIIGAHEGPSRRCPRPSCRRLPSATAGPRPRAPSAIWCGCCSRR